MYYVILNEQVSIEGCRARRHFFMIKGGFQQEHFTGQEHFNMSKVILHYTLTKQEEKLWAQAELRGWREAMQGFVEDEARDQGYSKYAIYGRDNTLILKSAVSALPSTVEVNV